MTVSLTKHLMIYRWKSPHDYKNLNQADIDEAVITFLEENVYPLFNDHVTTDEMLTLLRPLKNNKSSGND